ALLALHGSVGPEKDWAASAEYRRRGGVELVLNRLEMAARLESDVVIMHAAASISAATDGVSPWEALRRSLDELEPCARRLGVRIAIENGDWPTIRALLSAYSPDFLGLCYDSGHGNVDGNGLTELAAVKERLIAIHLHDNNGHEDEHRLPFTGTVDWAQLAEIIASSAYVKCISLESTIHKEKVDSEETFLAQAFLAAQRLSAMVETARGKEIA
ncbi:MAG: sugar phosphate isomerase/epimerase, partial [Planctomycetota bacterium]|nr:sugar phosphate isomerase/epimerase [Planctomycetota bacterium]